MPITALDAAKARGAKADADGSISMRQFQLVGIPMFGGCQGCAASIAAYNAYPSKSGYWRCKECLGEDGFESIEEFEAFVEDELGVDSNEYADAPGDRYPQED